MALGEAEVELDFLDVVCASRERQSARVAAKAVVLIKWIFRFISLVGCYIEMVDRQLDEGGRIFLQFLIPLDESFEFRQAKFMEVRGLRSR